MSTVFEPVTEIDVTDSLKSAVLFATSLQKYAQRQDDLAVELLLNFFAQHDFYQDTETRALIGSLNPQKIEKDIPGLVALLNHFAIHPAQLSLIERLLDVPHLSILAVLPEGKRACYPLAAFMGAPDTGFNRLNVYARPLEAELTCGEITDILNRRLPVPVERAYDNKEEYYLGFSPVKELWSAFVYLHIAKKMAPLPVVERQGMN